MADQPAILRTSSGSEQLETACYFNGDDRRRILLVATTQHLGHLTKAWFIPIHSHKAVTLPARSSCCSLFARLSTDTLACENAASTRPFSRDDNFPLARTTSQHRFDRTRSGWEDFTYRGETRSIYLSTTPPPPYACGFAIRCRGSQTCQNRSRSLMVGAPRRLCQGWTLPVESELRA